MASDSDISLSSCPISADEYEDAIGEEDEDVRGGMVGEVGKRMGERGEEGWEGDAGEKGETGVTGTGETAQSVLRSSISKYGQNSYYYAHSRATAPPEHAKVMTGPGIVTGGAPVRISPSPPLCSSSFSPPLASSSSTSTGSSFPPSPPSPPPSDRVVERLKQFAWCDDGDYVKVYVELAKLPPTCRELVERGHMYVGMHDTQVKVEIEKHVKRKKRRERRNGKGEGGERREEGGEEEEERTEEEEEFEAVVYEEDEKREKEMNNKSYVLELIKLNEKIVPVDSSHNVSKTKITLKLKKKDTKSTWYKLTANYL